MYRWRTRPLPGAFPGRVSARQTTRISADQNSARQTSSRRFSLAQQRAVVARDALAHNCRSVCADWILAFNRWRLRMSCFGTSSASNDRSIFEEKVHPPLKHAEMSRRADGAHGAPSGWRSMEPCCSLRSARSPERGNPDYAGGNDLRRLDHDRILGFGIKAEC